MELSSIGHEYLTILTDPAHSLVEFTFVLFDLLVIDTVRRGLKRHFHRDLSDQHTRLDREHGVAFHGALSERAEDITPKPYDHESSGL